MLLWVSPRCQARPLYRRLCHSYAYHHSAYFVCRSASLLWCGWCVLTRIHTACIARGWCRERQGTRETMLDGEISERRTTTRGIVNDSQSGRQEGRSWRSREVERRGRGEGRKEDEQGQQGRRGSQLHCLRLTSPSHLPPSTNSTLGKKSPPHDKTHCQTPKTSILVCVAFLIRNYQHYHNNIVLFDSTTIYFQSGDNHHTTNSWFSARLFNFDLDFYWITEGSIHLIGQISNDDFSSWTSCELRCCYHCQVRSFQTYFIFPSLFSYYR